MSSNGLNHAWVQQAQRDAERGVIECRICRQPVGLDNTITLWRNGLLVFAICDCCATRHDILMQPVEAGLEVRARPRSPLVIHSPHTPSLPVAHGG